MGVRLLRQRAIPVVSGFAVVLLVGLLFLAGWIASWDRPAWDLMMRSGGPFVEPDSSIVLLAVDQPGLDFFADNGVLWPWPRDLWGHLIYLAESAGAKGILFDVLFDDIGIDRLNSDAYSTDLALAQYLGGEFPVVIAAQLLASGLPLDSIPTGLPTWSDGITPYKKPSEGIRLPHQRFRHSSIGISNVDPEDDGVIRWVPLTFDTGTDTLPSLTLRILQSVEGRGLRIPKLDPNGRLWLRYYGPGGSDGAFPYLSAAAVVTGRVSPDQLKDKLLIVGGFASGLLDYKPTPVAEPQHPYPGFEIHATAISNILQGEEMIPLSRPVAVIYLLLVGFIAVIVMDRISKGWIQLVMLPVLGLSVAAIAWVAFLSGLLIPVLPAMVASVGGIGAVWFAEWRIEGRKRGELKRLFGRYLHEGVIDEMLGVEGEVELAGREMEVVVMFGDLVGFTNASEKLTPKEVVAMLNEYYEGIVEKILLHHGFLDKFIGDAIMVLFGAPLADERTSIRAATAVLEVMEVVKQISSDREKRGDPTMEMRYGLHLDSVIVGNIGHHNRMDYTAIGSGVNTASRLESATRKLGARVLVSDSFASTLPETFKTRKIGRVTLKGLTVPLMLHELLPEWDCGPWVEEWEQAWTLWGEGRRGEAVARWKEIQTQRPDDPAVPILLERMAPAQSSNGGDDDIIVFTSK